MNYSASTSIYFGVFFVCVNIVYVAIYYLTFNMYSRKYGNDKFIMFPPYKIFNDSFINNYPSNKGKNLYKILNNITYSFICIIIITFILVIVLNLKDSLTDIQPTVQ